MLRESMPALMGDGWLRLLFGHCSAVRTLRAASMALTGPSSKCAAARNLVRLNKTEMTSAPGPGSNVASCMGLKQDMELSQVYIWFRPRQTVCIDNDSHE